MHENLIHLIIILTTSTHQYYTPSTRKLTKFSQKSIVHMSGTQELTLITYEQIRKKCANVNVRNNPSVYFNFFIVDR